jgi:hypothetical protein
MVRELFETNVKYSIYLPPNQKPVFDYFLDVITGNFIEWTRLIPNSEILIKQNKSDDIITTIDSVRFSFLSTLLLQGKHMVLISGGSGIGKSVIIQSMLKRLKKTGYSLKDESILGEVYNHSDKSKANLANVSSMFSDELDGSKKSKSEELGG